MFKAYHYKLGHVKHTFWHVCEYNYGGQLEQLVNLLSP